MTRTAAALLLALVASGCAEESRGDAPDGCIEVSDAVASEIIEGNRAALGAPPQAFNARFAEARDVRGTLVVAIYVTGAGGVEDTGLWAVDAVEGDPGQIRTVDSLSRELTYWPADALAESDPGVAITRDCV